MEAKETWNPREARETKETAGFVPPMQAVKANELPEDIEWIVEPECKGDRVEVVINNGAVTLYAKDGAVLKGDYNIIAGAFAHLDYDITIDGEIVMMDSAASPGPDRGGQKTQNGEEQVVYCVFDILFLNGSSTRMLPLTERKELLKDLLATISSIHVQCTEYVKGKGPAVLEKAKEHHWQEIVAKEAESPYQENRHRPQWRRIKL